MQGRPALIVPGAMGDAEVDLAVALGVPVLGGHPAVAAAVSTKTGARALFQQAHVNVAPGQTVPPVEGPLAHVEEAAGLDARLLMDFRIGADGLQVQERGVPPSWPQGGRARDGRKDAVLCEALANLMVKHPLASVWRFVLASVLVMS